MKLSEYIYKELVKINVLEDPIESLNDFDIERWVIDWYKEKYARVPPMWLVGRRK